MRSVYARARAVALAAALATCALTLAVGVPSYAAEVPSPAATDASAVSGASAASASASNDSGASPAADSGAEVPVDVPPSLESNVAEATEAKGAADAVDAVPTQAARSAQVLAAAPAPAALAAGDPTSCVYANATSGEYKDSLCWIDFSYTNSAGARVPVTTEYQQIGPPTTTCRRSGRSYICTSTITFSSVMGEQYGYPVTTSATVTDRSQTVASSNSVANALTNMQSTLYFDGGVYYGNVKDYPVTVPLSEGAYTFTAKLSMSADRGSAQEVRGYKFPTYSAAYLGNSLYVVPADIRDSVRPALYQGPSSANGGTTKVVLSDIQVTQGSSPFSGYSVVVADAESTDGGESIAWTQTGGQGFRWLPNDPTAFAAATSNVARKSAAVGNACSATSDAMWADLASPNLGLTCSAAPGETTKTGTAMLQALPPTLGGAFSVTQSMKGNGLQGIAFGVLTSRASVSVKVDDRILTSAGAPSTGSFTASITGSGLTRTADTGASALTASRTLELPVPSGGSQLTFATATTAPNAASYTVAWTCTKTGNGATTQWPSNGSATPPAANDPWFVLQPSAFIACTVTYTPPYLTLTKTVDNGSTGATNTANQFVLTATGSGLSTASAPGSPATRFPVAAGTYALSESGPTVTPWQYGYDWSSLTCTSASGPAPAVTRTTDAGTGAVTSATVAVVKGSNATCTYTNTALTPRLSIAKSADPASGIAVDPGQKVTYTLTFDNTTGTAAAPVNHTDHLRDVLDDAVLDASSIRYGTGTVPPSSTTPSGVTATPSGLSSSTPTIVLTGSVPRGAVRTVSFSVTVKATATDAAARRAESAPLAGYVLRNYLTAAGAQPPAVCTPPASGPATCTEHNVRMPSIVLPLAGGAGWTGPALLGGVLVLLAIAAAWWWRRRSAPDHTTSPSTTPPTHDEP